MKVVGLVSGGKDSCFAMMKCVQYGHQIVALANLLPADDSVDELDSYMYQTVGHQIVVSYSKCMGVPLFRRRIQGSTRDQNLSYKMTPGDEVEDMFILLNEIKRQIPSITAVSSGAIASDYQRLRVESVCSRLSLVSLAYLWKQDQSMLLKEMIESGLVAIFVKVAAIGLDPRKHLGKELSYLNAHLLKLKELYGSNVCGEGGEYETLTFDCPLFKNARIVLDEFEVVLHSSDSIAPVGILHPLKYHLEHKQDDIIHEEMDSVWEVQNSILNFETKCQPEEVVVGLLQIENRKLHISKTKRDSIFSMSCWVEGSCEISADLQEDLKAVLQKTELELTKDGLSWENVLYIHMYIADMNKFAIANETYVKFITQEKCRFGVPSRSTIELPLLEVGLGRAYIEVLAAKDESKRVLHVQSISCWAPSCIGPYSQATLHREIVHMAGQLGLDPPTMLLCSGGPSAELEQALENSEAVAKSFNCSISLSTILFVVYCSSSIPTSQIPSIQEKLEAILEQMKSLHLDSRNVYEVVSPLFLFVLVSDLPKGAFVEVKPILYAPEHEEITTDDDAADLPPKVAQSKWEFQYENWHELCLKKCIVQGKLCAAIISVTDELAVKICSQEFSSSSQDNIACQDLVTEAKIEMVARFCANCVDKVLAENNFSWDDATNMRVYYRTSLNMSHETMSRILGSVFDEFSGKCIMNLIPVLGAGKASTCMDDIMTCELFATKS
jgi:diphthine-ammonia ligase